MATTIRLSYDKSFLRVTAGKPTPSLTGGGGPLCYFTRTPVTPSTFTLSTPSGNVFSSSAFSVLTTSPTPSSALHFVEHPGPLPGTSFLEAQSLGYLCLDPSTLTLAFTPSASHATPFTLSPVRGGGGNNGGGGGVSAPPKKSPSPLPPLSTLTAPTSVCLFYGQEGKTINVIGKGNRATGNGGGGPFATFLLHPTLSLSTPNLPPTSFTLQAHNGAHLAVVEDGKVTTTPTPTQALHLIPSGSGSGEVTLQCSLGKGYLTVGAAPMLLLTLGPKENATLFTLGKSKMGYKEAVEAAAASAAAAAATPLPNLPPPLPFSPSPTFLSDFKTNGYVIIPGAVPPMAVEAALRVINHSLGEVILASSSTPPPSTPLQDWKHSSHPTLTGLYACTRVKGGVEALLVEDTAPSVMKGCQVAPRFPKPLTPEQSFGVFTTSATLPTPPTPPGPSPSLLSQHLKEGRKQGDDGRWHVDGMEKGRAYPFSLLIGVFLSDTLEAGAGQFTVFPGSHLHLAKVVAEGGEGVLYGEEVKHNVSLPPHCSKPLELMVKAGDAVLVHPLLAHRVGVNYSPHVRHACFFRVSAVGHEKARAGLVTGDLFGEVRAVTAAV